MALAILELPSKTTYHFTNTTGENVPDYTVQVSPEVAFSNDMKALSVDGVRRYIINPSTVSSDITGTYTVGGKKFTIPKDDLTAIKGGSYQKFVVDGGSTGAATVNYNIQKGDFLMRDGSLLPKSTTLTATQKADVAAIVFWTPAETATTGRTYPAKLSDDKVMTAHFPNCTHGLAVALKDMETIYWCYCELEGVSVGDFQNSNSFSPTNPDKTKYNPINSDDDDILHNTISGYQNTQVLKAYNEYCYNLYKIQPVDKLDNFTASNPAPAGSTGWYIPSAKELHMLCYKDVDYPNAFQGAAYTETRDIVQKSLSDAGGDQFIEDWYYIFASNESDEYEQYSICLYNASYSYGVGEIRPNDKKIEQRYVRAVCAF